LEIDVPLLFRHLGGENVQEVQTYTQSEPVLNICEPCGAKDEMNQTLSRCRPLFFKSAYRFLENAADAEDAVQDALLSAFRHIDQFRGEAQMSTWLTAIVSNSARMHLRRRPRQIHLSLDEPMGEAKEYRMSELLADHRPTPEEECRHSELYTRLKELSTQLSPSLRKAFQLRDLEGLSTNEAARILGVADGTVKAQLARARAKLRRLLGQARKPRVSARVTGKASPGSTEK
jgi:RNA polymerase sigma factor (sigma-70 family)